MTNKEYADGLRMIADFFEAHPEVDVPSDGHEFKYFNLSGRAAIKTLAKALGTFQKVYEKAFAGSFELQHQFGKITFRAIDYRANVCKRVKTGERLVPAQVVPAQPAQPERVVAEHVEEVFEWRCDESLLRLDEEAAEGSTGQSRQVVIPASRD